MDTSFFSHLNWLAVAAATLGYFALGALWYSVLFGKLWIKATGVKMDNPEARKGAGAIFLVTLILEFVAVVGIAILVYRLGLTAAISGIKLGLVTGICFAGIGISVSYLYQMKPKVLSVIDSGYHIGGHIIAAVILCLWH
jgi:hypothetical protein